jgi:hypothetical protein
MPRTSVLTETEKVTEKSFRWALKDLMDPQQSPYVCIVHAYTYKYVLVYV